MADVDFRTNVILSNEKLIRDEAKSFPLPSKYMRSTTF